MSDETGKKFALRMDAYYGFYKTNMEKVDIVLSAIACAGKGFHHTESWGNEEREDYGPFKGKSYIEWIQNAANDAAIEFKALQDQNKQLRETVRAMAETIGFYADTENYRRPDRDRNGMGGMSAQTDFEIEDGEWKLDSNFDKDHYCYGKRARQCLTAHAEIIERCGEEK